MISRVLFHLGWAVVATTAIVADTVLRLPFDFPGALVWPLGLVAYPLAGALILIHRPGNRVGRVVTVVGVTAGVISAADWFALTWGDSPWNPYVEVLGVPGFTVIYWGLVSLLYLFPTGETLTGWRRRLFVVFTVVTLGVVSVVATVTTETFEDSGTANPLYVEGFDLGVGFGAALVVLGVGAVGGIGSVTRRLRQSVGVERAQMKVFLVGGIAFVVILGAALSLPESADPSGDPLWTYLVVVVGLLAMPAAITAAILRYRLYDIDRLVSRTVSYTLVGGVLAAVFAVVTIGLPQWFGVADDAPLLVAGATLAAAALFNPLRRRFQDIVDRRFNRARYDAQQEVDAFAESLRTGLDIDDLTGELIGVVAKTMQPVSATIWIQERSG